MNDFVSLSTGLVVPEWLAEKYAPKQRRPIAIDLFAGCGGMSCGIIAGGFEVVAAADYDAQAAITYCLNLGAHPMKIEGVEPEDLKRLEKALGKSMGYSEETNTVAKPFITGSGWRSGKPEERPGVSAFFVGDIRKLTGERILNAVGLQRGDVDLVCGGPPCQGFSFAGKRNVMDPRNSLVFDFARLILEIDPKTMCMENVPGIIDMVTPEGIPVLDAFCRILEDGGFGAFDLLKKSLAVSAGVGGALKGHGKPKRQTGDEEKKKEPRKRKKKVLKQLELL